MSVNIIQRGSDPNKPEPNPNSLCGMIEVGNLSQVEVLIANGINVNEIDAESGLTPLETAADEGNVAIANRLLAAGASVCAGTVSPLLLGAAKGHTDVVKMLLDTGNYAEAAEQVDDAFMRAVASGHLETVRIFVERGIPVNQLTWDGGSPLQYATDEGYLAIATLLLEAGAEVNVVNPFTGKTPLIAAVSEGHLELVRLLIEAEADLEIKDKEGKTALMLAAAYGHAEIASLLIKGGADINATDTYGNNALVYTANAEATTPVKPMVTEEMSAKGETALVEEIKRLNELEQTLANLKKTGQKAIAEMLRQAGASEEGVRQVAFITAAAEGNLDQVREFIEAGVNLNAKDTEGRTALLEACEENHVEVVAALLDGGANVNLGESDRFAPLMIAAYRGHKAIVEMLLEAGADIDQTTPYHYTALSYAEEGLHTEIVELLQQNGLKSHQMVTIAEKRGIESLDFNHQFVLVQSSIEAVADALFQLRQAQIWEKDMLEREVKLTPACFLVFQFQGHSWTLIHGENIELGKHEPLGEQDAKALSQQLQTKAIYYRCSDTAGAIAYHLFEFGKSLEDFAWGVDYSEEMQDLLQEYGEEANIDSKALDPQSYNHFSSQLRQINITEIEDVFAFVNRFFKSQDAYIPAWQGGQFNQTSESLTLSLIGLNPEAIERMDFVAVV